MISQIASHQHQRECETPRHVSPPVDPYLGTLTHLIESDKSLNVINVITQIKARNRLAEAAPELCRSLGVRWTTLGKTEGENSLPKAVAAMGHHGHPLVQRCVDSLKKSSASGSVKELAVAIAAAGGVSQIMTGVTMTASRSHPRDGVWSSWQISRNVGDHLKGRLGLDLHHRERDVMAGLDRIAVTGTEGERWFATSVLFSMGASGETERSWGRCLARYGRPLDSTIPGGSSPSLGTSWWQIGQQEVNDTCAADLTAWSEHLVRTKRSHLLAQESGILNAVGALAITGRTPWSNEPLSPKTHDQICAQFGEIASGSSSE